MLKYYFVQYSKDILGITVSVAVEKLELKIEGEGVRGPIFI